MSKKRSREESRDHLIWLLRGLELWRNWKIDLIGRISGRKATQEDLANIVMPGDIFLNLFEKSPGSGNFAINFVEQWYLHATDEVKVVLNGGSEAAIREYQGFLQLFEEEFGKPFLSMAKTGSRQVKNIIKAGRIRNDAEHEIAQEVFIAIGAMLISEKEREKLGRILQEYEVKH